MLDDLPLEILSEIFSHLPYRDIVVLRQTLARKDLCSATESHAVWISLASRYLAKNPHSHLSNLPSLYSLTTNQLRELFEKRLIVDDVWQQSEPVYPSIKRIRRLPFAMLSIKIAPGGRWLFAGVKRCVLYYWDLDADDPEPVLLAPRDDVDDISDTSCNVAKIEIIAKSGDPLSGFILSLTEWGSPASNENAGEWLYIWDIVPLENGTLKAQSLKSLPLPYSGLLSQLSMNDHLVARSMKKRVDVYWWRDCTETHLVRCTLKFSMDSHITGLYVVGHDKLLIYTRYGRSHKVRLYALESERSKISKSQEVVPHAMKIWSHPFSYSGIDTSRLYFDGANYHQTISTHGGVFSLTLPALQPEKPLFGLVSSFSLDQHKADVALYGLGLSKGYCRVGTQLQRFGYSCSSESEAYEHGVPVDSRLHPMLQRLGSSPTFDEETGRLVSTARGYLVLQDFSLPLYNLADVCPDYCDNEEK